MWFGFSLVELKLGTQIMVDIEAPSCCPLKAIWEGDKVPREYREEQKDLVIIVSVHTHLIKGTCVF